MADASNKRDERNEAAWGEPRREPGGVPLPDLRAGDADRERVAERLRDALAEGRLDMDEFQERLDVVYRAKTYGELEPVTRDLPAPGADPGATPVSMTKRNGSGTEVDWSARVVRGGASSDWGVALLSGFQRVGSWVAPRRFNAVAVMGGGLIDLRDAYFGGPEIVVNCVAVMGGIEVVVPPGVEVVMRGTGLMGGFDHENRGDAAPPAPGAPRVVVTGLAFWGGVGVRTKRPKGPKGPKKRHLPHS
ncbi:DUF1707 domain-containing protein [Streptomyces sp. NPDC005012]|uniref:DUF1707 SHOCT-like domain-containing protein n=1 Tax=unclassified Streptomyces TaxID=2593676 RepID=UPI0033B05EA7